MAEEDSPLVQALPPVSDYITYLTIIEYNLSEASLPILHKVLQDETLTTNIGWDLIHLLVPYLPESELCLQDIGRLGNPREVILKVTESLRLIEYENADHDPEEAIDAVDGATDSHMDADSSTYPAKTALTSGGKSMIGNSQMVEQPPPLPLPVSQFIALLSMLVILHPRIKTKYPSRFLSTTLQAILASFSNSVVHREEMVLAIVKLVKSVRGIQRPTLPSRKSSGMLGSTPAPSAASAADPEAAPAVDSGPEETAMQTRLLQSFVTHVLEEYMLNLTSSDDVPGMSWCSRLMEKLHPERTIPETKTLGYRFANEDNLHRRIDAVGQLVALAQDLKLTDDVLFDAAVAEVKTVPASHDEDEPPASADDIPLSQAGCLFILTARQASGALYESNKAGPTSPFDIFPKHHKIVQNCLSSPAHGTGSLGTEPEALVDAVLAMGLICLEQNAVGEPASDEQFNEYLQVTALLSSNCPSPNLRGHAHYLTSTILRAQPDDNVRLAFIRDTLEHCPFENLKVSAVGWIKGETIEANPPTPLADHHHQHTASAPEDEHSVFATPLALESLAPFLFPSLHVELNTTPVHDAWTTFQTNLSFYLTVLNFLYLLLCASHLHSTLGIQDLWVSADIAASFLQPLRDASARFGKELDGGGLVAERSSGTVAELALLDETLVRVTRAVGNLNSS